MTLDREALEVSDSFVYTTGKAVLNGDYDLFRPCFGLPYQVEANNEARTITEEADMRVMFDQITDFYRKMDVQDLVRTVIEASFLDRGTIGVTFVSKLITPTPTQIKPFPTYSILRRTAGKWKIRSAFYAFVEDGPHMSKIYTPRMTSRDPFKTQT